MLFINFLCKKIVFSIILALTVSVATSQFGEDTIFYLKQSPFLLNLIKKENNFSSVHSGNIRLYGLNQKKETFIYDGEFLDVPGKGFFFHIYNTGRLYLLDSSTLVDSLLLFKRVDATVNLYYNIGSFLFSKNKEIYEYGGYGFWKNNGILRRYNFTDKEWDVVELEKEIFPPNSVSDGFVAWIDSAKKYLYVPYQDVRNDGIAMREEDADLIYDSYRLDLNSFKWERLGKMDKRIQQLMKFSSHIFQSNKGLLLVYINRIYWVDYVQNKIKVSYDPSVGQTLLRVQPFMLRYWNDDYVFWSNPVNGRYDSIRVDLEKFTDSNQVIWKENFKRNELLLFGLIAGVLALFFINRSQVRTRKQLEESAVSPVLEAPFSGTELALLELLLIKNKQERTATIPEINYVLGLKDKNHGMQKKVRSEIINRINEKYMLISKGKELLIQNIRSESDKRFFEYLLNPDLVVELRKLMAQSA